LMGFGLLCETEFGKVLMKNGAIDFRHFCLTF
jgi:hypothetical protein